MARTDKKVGYTLKSNLELAAWKAAAAERGPPLERANSAAESAEEALKTLEGRWKLLIIFHLITGGPVLRFSELQRAIPGVSQKMLIQQLRELERDGVLNRTVYPVVPPKVEYSMTEVGQALCPALHELLQWSAYRRSFQKKAAEAAEATPPEPERKRRSEPG
jgi:DNA-binding HxlR family transcriptional regulator